MKELQETNNKIVQNMTANNNAAEYQRIINSFANKHAWSINNSFTGKLAIYGMLAGSTALVLYKLGVLGTVCSYIGGMLNLSYKAVKSGLNTLGFLGTIAVNTGSKVKSIFSNIFPDHTKVNSVNEYSNYTNRRINITNMMIQKLLSYMGPGKGYMSLIVSNMDQIIFEKDPRKLVEFCDNVMNGLKGFNMNDCMSDLVNVYNILHSEYPEIFNELTDPETFNKMISTIINKDTITSKDIEPYRNINDFDELKKYLIDYKNNPQQQKSSWFNNIPNLPIFNTQPQLANIFGTTGWSYMFIQFLNYIYSFLTRSKADNSDKTNNDNPDERTESSVGSYDEGVNLINSATEGLDDPDDPDDPDDNTFYSLLKYLIPDYDGDHVDNVDNFERNESSSKRTEEDEVNTINIDSYNQNEDIEMGIRKRK